jgi:hypothetical protein
MSEEKVLVVASYLQSASLSWRFGPLWFSETQAASILISTGQIAEGVL